MSERLEEATGCTAPPSSSSTPEESRVLQGRTLDGVRYLRAEQYNLSVGGRYKVVSGYKWAPYIEGSVGVMWMVLGCDLDGARV